MPECIADVTSLRVASVTYHICHVFCFAMEYIVTCGVDTGKLVWQLAESLPIEKLAVSGEDFW